MSGPAEGAGGRGHGGAAATERETLPGRTPGPAPRNGAADDAPCIAIVSSCGGHLTEVRALRAVYERYRHFYVLNEVVELPPDMVGRTYFIRHAERDWRVLGNFWEAWRILRRERPTLLLSTGAGPIVPFAAVGKLLGIPTIYIENAGQVRRPSLTGRIMYHLADRFFYQWPDLGRYFPRGTYGGPLPWSS